MSILWQGQFGTPLGYQQYTTLSSAIGLTSIPKGATYALIQVEGENVRWRDDGTAPTASLGMILIAGNEPDAFIGSVFKAAKFIQVSSSATLNVSYYS
jgi:hypothetical protein